jgi:hypothetical protein
MTASNFLVIKFFHWNVMVPNILKKYNTHIDNLIIISNLNYLLFLSLFFIKSFCLLSLFFPRSPIAFS